ENPSGVRAVIGYPGSDPARGGKPVGKGAMAWTATGRHLHPARQLDVLLPAGDRPAHFHHPDHPLLALRAPLSLREGARVHRRVRRTGDALLPWVAPLAVLVLTLGWAPAARAAGTIRVAVVEGARAVEVGGGPDAARDVEGPGHRRADVRGLPAAAQCGQALPHRRVHRPPAVRRSRRSRLTRVDGGAADAGAGATLAGEPLPRLLPHRQRRSHGRPPRRLRRL